ncbi:MAG: hypothetical protein GX832_00875, partial [Clostridiales bacterium]|nr:hypothetical protein [Clostridiales bacterium]
AMTGDYSWLHSAREYVAIYQEIVPQSTPEGEEQFEDPEQPEQTEKPGRKIGKGRSGRSNNK